MDSEEKNTVWFQRRRKESFKIYCFCAARVGEHETCATGQILLVGNCAFPDNFFIERAIVFGRRSICNRLCYYFNRLLFSLCTDVSSIWLIVSFLIIQKTTYVKGVLNTNICSGKTNSGGKVKAEKINLISLLDWTGRLLNGFVAWNSAFSLRQFHPCYYNLLPFSRRFHILIDAR